MSETPATQRGRLLMAQSRYAEAEKYFREALASDPNNCDSLFHLALCELQQQRAKPALESIMRALALEPESAAIHALRACILTELARLPEALAAAEEAVRLDPDLPFAYTATAGVYLRQGEWAKAEAAARKALELDPEHDVAANQLAHALRLQNRLAESSQQIDYMLEQDPESSSTHSAAGWVALQRGQNRQAEVHFLEALRLNASNDAAREGLKEAFRARSPIYRAYLQYCFFMQRFTQGKQWLLIVGLFLGIKVVGVIFPPLIAGVLIGLYMLFVLWVHVARGVGNFQLVLDRFARHALTASEKWEAWFVGAAVLLGLLLGVIALVAKSTVTGIIGLTLVGAAFPFAHTFTNRSVPGRILFGAVGVFVYFVGLCGVVSRLTPDHLLASGARLFPLAILAVVAVTWLCNVSFLKKR